MHKDLRKFDDETAKQHYYEWGREEGRVCGPIKSRDDFLKIVPDGECVLEIGPFLEPCYRAPKHDVRYFDVLDREGLVARAREHIDEGVFPAERFEPAIEACPEIHYVHPTGDLSSINRTFQYVLSCHCAEHQPDLIAHINGVADHLDPGGLYLMILPDKRYGFDHFLPETRTIDIVSAHLSERKLHTVEMVLEHRLETTHNDPVRHWNGDHGMRRWDEYTNDRPDLFPHLWDEAKEASVRYIDVHQWKFTPETFRRDVRRLRNLGLINLSVERVYPTLRDSMEFYAVLRKSQV